MIHDRMARLMHSRWGEPLGILLVAALVLGGSAAEAYPGHHYGGLHLRQHPTPGAFLVLVVPVAALVLRRSRPVAVYAVAVAGVATWAALGQVYGAALVVVLVAFASLALERPGWVAQLALGAGGTITIWVVGGVRGPWGWWGGPQFDMWPEMVAAGAFGAFVAARRHWRQSEQLRQDQLAVARAEEVRTHITTERLRIARELHDVIAHSMAMINVQASAAVVLLERDRRGAAESLEAIRRASKDGLRELRAILDVLRQVDEDEPVVLLPDHGAFDALAHAAAAGGVPTTLECDVEMGTLSAETALAAYRIVQESLTNVIRHARGARATVRVTARGPMLWIEVRNDTRGRSEVFAEGAGSGLRGMEERVRSLGGSFAAGPLPDGGFLVQAALPAAAGGRPAGEVVTSAPAALGL